MTSRQLALLCGLAALPPAVAGDGPNVFVARAYCISGRTADGSRTAPGVIAADTRVLPFGTRVLITGAGAYNGEYTVHDTGGFIKGHRLDMFIPTRAAALRFGVRRVRVTILKPLPDPPPLRAVPPPVLLSMDAGLPGEPLPLPLAP